jgi:hypothetical protein
MNEITTRTTELIAAEIINIKEQTKKMVIYNSIEIGRRLVEAKEMIEHGEWGKWLEKSINYSQSTANNLMKIFNEYGSDQITLLNNNSKSQALGNLSYTQAIALLGIPSEERETFIKENDVEEMSTRELQKAIKEKQDLEEKLKDSKEFNIKANELATKYGQERDMALKTLEDTKKINRDTQANFETLETALQKEKDNLKKEKEHSKEEIAKFQSFIGEAQTSGDEEEVKRLQASLKEIQNDLDTSALRIDELETQLQQKPVDVTETIVEKIPEEIEKELAELRAKSAQGSNTSVTEFKVYFKYLNETFDKELKVMADIKISDPQTYEKCKSNILRLVNSMAEKL